MRKILCFFFFLSIFPSQGQLLRNQEGQAFTDIPFFNPTFIKEMGVTELNGKIYTKKLNDILRETNGFLHYKFDEKGQLTTIQWYKPYLPKRDSICTSFIYDSVGNCIEVMKGIETGGLNTQYKYLNGLIIEKIQNVLSKDGKRILLFKEEYKYQEIDTVQNILCKNQFDLVFSEITKTWNSKGYLLSKTTKGVMSNETIVESFQYDLKGLLSSIITYKNGDIEPTKEICYSYDEIGNLITLIEIKNGNSLQEIQVVYNRNNMLPSSIIYYDRRNEFMEVIRFN